MSSKQHSIIFIGMLMLIVALVGFFILRNPKEMIVIGANQWIGYEPLYVARANGDLLPNEFRLVLYSSTEEVLRAYRNGLVDVAAVTGDEFLQVSRSVPETRAFLVTDISNGADAIISQSEIQSVKELQGKKIAVEAGAVGAYMLTRALQKNGMSVKDVTPVYSLFQNHLSLFQKGEVDAVVTFEPNRTKLINSGGREIFTSKAIPDEIVDLMIAREELLADRKKDIHKLVSIWYKSLEKIESRSTPILDEIAHRQGIGTNEVRESLEGIMQPDSTRNFELLSNPEKLPKTLRSLSETMVEASLIPEGNRASPMITTEFIGRHK